MEVRKKPTKMTIHVDEESKPKYDEEFNDKGRYYKDRILPLAPAKEGQKEPTATILGKSKAYTLTKTDGIMLKYILESIPPGFEQQIHAAKRDLLSKHWGTL